MHRYPASACLCESYREREGRVSVCQRGLCEWKSQQRGTRVCRSDGVHSLTAEQIPRSSNKKRNVPHFNPQSSVTGPNNSNETVGHVSSILHKEENTKFIREKASDILSALQTCFCPKNIICPRQQNQMAPTVDAGDYVM